MDDRRRMLLILIPVVIVIGLLVVGLAIFLLRGKKLINPLSRKPKNVEIVYLGLYEEEEVIKPLLDEYVAKFQAKNPKQKLEIKYEKRTFPDNPDNPGKRSIERYRSNMLSRLENNEKIDIVRLHSTWIPEFYKELAPLPEQVLSSKDYSETFYRIATQQNTFQNEIYAMPLMYDGLVLLCNEGLFSEAGLSTPTPEDKISWLQFEEYGKQLTKHNGSTLTQAGAAIGSGANIPFSSDILGLMLAQVGVTNINDLDTESAIGVLDLYKSFVTDARVWDQSSFSNALEAFTAGRVAMIFAPSWVILDVRELNPGLKLVVAPVPQLPTSSSPDVNWASYWVEAVSKDSESPEIAWDILKYLSSRDGQQRMFNNAKALRDFGEPYSRVDMQGELISDKYLGPVVAGAPNSYSWYITDYSGDGMFTSLVKEALDSGGESKTLLSNLKNKLIEEAKNRGYSTVQSQKK